MKFIRVDRTVQTKSYTMNNFHSHVFYEMYILISGNRKLFIDNQLFKIHAPAIILIPPHCLHRTEGEPYDRYNINIMPQHIGEFERSVLVSAEKIVVYPKKADFDFMLNIADRLNAIEAEHLSPAEAEHIAKALFVSFLFVYRSQIVISEDIKQKPDITASYLTLQVLDFFDEHYSEKISLDSLAEYLYVSPSTIIHAFKKDLACTPIDFLLKVRINKAKEMLLNTNKKITDIAFDCGFSSPIYFGNIFKAKEGLSPRDYRKFRNLSL